ncbi:tyrosine-type recombinase/integrase [Meiothermus taiwanensis]|uniref:tyrosine-type recombinase/integrase n=1 Tax=Meiothermus taiwanensis TaxID=172827 RepID=UPI0009DB9282|nr:tyrosine-type recombinase/integrase [Meiothermus taiwanensis]
MEESLRHLLNEFMTLKEEQLSATSYRNYRFALNKFLDYCASREVVYASQVNARFLLTFAAWTRQQHKGELGSQDQGQAPRLGRAYPAAPGADLRQLVARVRGCCWAKPLREEGLSQGFLPQARRPQGPACSADVGLPQTLRDGGKNPQPPAGPGHHQPAFRLGTACVLCNLELTDLRDDGTVLIRQGKGGKDRIVPVSRQVRIRINRYLRQERGEHESQALFLCGYAGHVRAMNRLSLRQLIERLCDKAGVPHMTSRSFWRGMVTEMDANAVSRKVIQQLMGHSRMKMVDTYSKLSVHDAIEAHRKGSPLSAKR